MKKKKVHVRCGPAVRCIADTPLVKGKVRNVCFFLSLFVFWKFWHCYLASFNIFAEQNTTGLPRESDKINWTREHISAQICSCSRQGYDRDHFAG